MPDDPGGADGLSPVPPGTGWPQDPATPSTPVAGTQAGVRALAATAGTLDELVSKFMALGFVLITLAVIAGSTWAFIELQANWIRQPKIAISFFTWGTYLAMMCLRVTVGWRGRKAAVMALTVVGFSVVTWAAHARLGSLLLK